MGLQCRLSMDATDGGTFRFDPSEPGLWVGGDRVACAPRVLELLAAFVERPGRLVRRAELAEAIWSRPDLPPETVRYAVRQLRLALGDSAETPRFVETVGRTGWRLIASVVRERDGTRRLTPHGGSGGVAGGGRPDPLLVGRETERHQLSEALAAARGGSRQLVLVSGEAGIGKTRLVESFLATHAGDPTIVVGSGQCVEEYGGGEAYLPLLEALERLCRSPGLSDPVRTLRRCAPMWLAEIPALSDPSEREVLRRETQGASQGRMMRELSLALEALAIDPVVVLWLEDLHWSDLSTLEFLTRCMRRPEPARLLILASYRPGVGMAGEEPFTALRRDLAIRESCIDLKLPFLEQDEVAAYLDARVGPARDADARATLARHVFDKTGGQPIFMAGLIDDLLRSGVVEPDPTGWQLTGEIGERGQPESMRQLLQHGRADLDAEERLVLEAASVAGMRFAASTLSAALDRDVEQIEERCLALSEDRRFLAEAGRDTWPDGTGATCFRFLHALHREIVGTGVPDARRALWQQRIGERKLAGWKERADEIAAELARHFAGGNDVDRASQFFMASGDAAARMSSSREAVDEFRQALAWLTKLPEDETRTSRELLTRLSLSAPLAATAGYAAAEMEANLRRIEALATGLEDRPEFLPLLLGLWSLYLVRGEIRASEGIGQRLVALDDAGDPSDPLFHLQAHRTLALSRLFLGDPDEAAAQLALAIDGIDSDAHQRLDYRVGDDPVVLAHAYDSWIAWFGGDAGRSREATIRSCEIARRLEHGPSLAVSLAFAGVAHQLRRDVVATQETARALHELAEADGLSMWSALARILGGWATARATGRLPAGLGMLHQGLEAWDETGSELGRPYFLCMFGELLAEAGRIAEAEAVLERVEDSIARTGQVLFEPERLRLAAEIGVRRDPPTRDEAFAALLQAQEAARDVGSPALGLRAAWSLYRHADDGPALDDASRRLAAALDRCTESDADREQQEIRERLGRALPAA